MKPRARTFASIIAATVFAPGISFAVIALPFAHRAHAAPSRPTHAARSAEAIITDRESSNTLDAERVSATEPAPQPAAPAPPRAPAQVHAKAQPKPTPGATIGLDFDAAQAALGGSTESLPICSRGEVSGPGVAEITWDESGQVARVALSDPYAGTRTGACVARRFARASVKPFEGPAVSMRVRFAL
jgi:hypothetical protein